MNNALHNPVQQIVCISLEEYTGLIEQLSSYKTLFKLTKEGRISPSDLAIVDLNQELDHLKTSEITPHIIKKAHACYLESKDEPSSDPTSFVKQVAVQDIKKRREELNITQSELAKMAGINQAQLSRLEKSPETASGNVLRKLATALKIKIIIPPE